MAHDFRKRRLGVEAIPIEYCTYLIAVVGASRQQLNVTSELVTGKAPDAFLAQEPPSTSCPPRRASLRSGSRLHPHTQNGLEIHPDAVITNDDFAPGGCYITE